MSNFSWRKYAEMIYGKDIKESRGKMKDYEDKDINSMILFLRINKLAEIQYTDSYKQNKFFDYIQQSYLTRKEVINYALENDWKSNWKK